MESNHEFMMLMRQSNAAKRRKAKKFMFFCGEVSLFKDQFNKIGLNCFTTY